MSTPRRRIRLRRLAGARAGRAAAGYDAFISYSHAVDGKLAPALQLGLHRFARRLLQLRALRVFRDEASLAADPALWSAIESALGRSRHLLLLASPESAASVWVGREIAYWREHKPSAKLLVVLSDGELVWDEDAQDFDWPATTALPESMVGFFAEEPRWVDVRWARSAEDVSLRNPRFRSAIADLAAPLHGRSKDELIGEDVRQHRRAKALAWGGVSALTVLLAVAAVAAVLAVLARNDARAQTRVAESRRLAAQSSLNLQERPDRALLLSAEAVDRAPTAEARASLLESLTSRPHLAGFIWPELRITAGPAVTSDGKSVVVGGTRGRLVSCSVAKRRCSRPFSAGFDGDVSAVTVSPADNTIAAAGRDGSVSLVELGNRTVRRSLTGLHETPATIVFSSDGTRLAAGTSGKRIAVWRTKDGSVRRFSRPVLPTEDGLIGLAFDESSSVLVMGAYTGEITMFDLRPRARARSIDVPYDGGLASIAFDPRSGRLVAASADGTLRLANTETGKVTEAGVEVPPSGTLSFSSNGARLAAVESEKMVVVDGRALDPSGIGEETRTLTDAGLTVATPAFAGDRTVVTRVRDDSLAVWTSDLGPRLGRVLDGRIGFGPPPIFRTAGDRPVGAAGRSILLWGARGRGRPVRLRAPAEITSMTVDSGRGILAAGLRNGRIHRWLLDPLRPLEPAFGGHADSVAAMAYSDDGTLVSLGSDGAVVRWAPGSSKPEHVLSRSSTPLEEGALAPEGRHVARLDGRWSLELIDLDQPGARRKLGRYQSFTVDALEFVEEGSVLVAATDSGERRWDVETGRSVAAATVSSALPGAVKGESLAATQGDDGVTVWDLETRRPLGVLPQPSPTLDGLALGPEEEWLMTGWGEGAAVWDVTTAGWIAAACATAGRVLTEAEWAEFRDGDYRPVCR